MTNLVRYIALGCAGACLSGINHAAEPNTAEVVSIVGKAERRPSVTAPWASAEIKQLLYSGNFVRTLDDSTMALLFSDKSQLRLSRNSMFEIKEIGNGKDTDTSVSLLKGKSWMQSKATPDKLRIATPSGLARILGTEWEMEVHDDGSTTVSVMNGEVHFTNESGNVQVQANEQAVTEVGRAPQKRVLLNPRERVQWVNSLRADGSWLFGSDAALFAGDFDKARQLLQKGALQSPNDDRIPAQLARIALLSNDWTEARRILTEARKRFPQSVELALVSGELARLAGLGAIAVQEFSSATARADTDYRAWHGLGITYAEQEHFAPARTALEKATQLAPQRAAPWADRGALETRAHRLDAAAQSINHALALAPDDYVAWTSRGILLLTQGDTDAALEALLKASLLEPRYAKAQIHTAIAWYQLGRMDAAMAAIAKAKQADPNDPLPYFYEAQMQRDALNPIAAIAAAQGARDRFPFMKSLAPIATDKQGSSSLGAAYAMLGLESWAKRLSAQTQHPFFAGSYLFAAERASDPLLRNSMLVQGYLTDPTLFGASPQRSTLLPRPAGYLSAEWNWSKADTFHSNTPSLIANGYSVAPIPVAGFVQWDSPRYSFGATTPSLITALGLRPHAQWGIFVYRDEFRPRLDDMTINTASDRIHGNVVRTDIGTQWQISPTSALWLRAGQGSDDTLVRSNVRSWDQGYLREDKDAGVRFTTLQPSGEWTLGYESGQSQKPAWTQALGTNTHSTILSNTASDSTRWFAAWKAQRGDWQWQLGGDYSDFQLNQTGSSTLNFVATGQQSRLTSPTIQRQWSGWSPSWGVAWNPSSHSTYRLAWQTGVRPANAVSLAPMDTVGIPIDIPGVQAGGSFKRLRAQGEWELAGNSYLTAFADHRTIDNLHDTAGNLLNPSSSLSQYDRLRQQGAATNESAETLEATPRFAAGTVVTKGLVWEQMTQNAQHNWSWSASYIHTRTDNVVYPRVALPYFPEHTVGLGVTWFAPQRWVLNAKVTGRSERTTNDTGTERLEPDWDVSLRATWQDSSKRQLFEIFGQGLGRKDQSALLGFRAVWRY